MITAESIIAGFMIAYGAVNGQVLVDWSRHGGRLTGTYIAGMLINGVVLTSLVSILFLLSSVPTNVNIKDRGDPKEDKYKQKYCAGYDLFLMGILGTAVFVVTNSFSIYRFTVSLPHVPMIIPINPLADILYHEFMLYAAFLLVLLIIGLVLNCKEVLNFFARVRGHGLLCFLLVAVVIAALTDSFAV